MPTFQTTDHTGDELKVMPVRDSVEASEYADNFIEGPGGGVFLRDEDMDAMMVTMLTNAGITDAPPCPAYVGSIHEARSYAKSFLLYAQRAHEADKREREEEKARNDERVKNYVSQVHGIGIDTVHPEHRKEYEAACRFAQAGGFDIND